jgi:uncharacterized hydantoinase/oxoprolinase family protein
MDGNMNAIPDTEKMASNATLQVMARLSMLATPLLIGGFMWFATGWVDAQAKVDTELRVDVDSVTGDLIDVKQKVAVLQNNQERGRADREAFQTEMSARLDRMEATLRLLAEGQAAINATLAAQQRQIERR